MTSGQEKLHRVNEVLNAFEQAVMAREHKGITQSATPLQQGVDRARAAVVQTVVDMVTKAAMEGSPG